jgi:hypothetical protein
MEHFFLPGDLKEADHISRDLRPDGPSCLAPRLPLPEKIPIPADVPAENKAKNTDPGYIPA